MLLPNNPQREQMLGFLQQAGRQTGISAHSQQQSHGSFTSKVWLALGPQQSQQPQYEILHGL
jgi:hypothetical protein